MNLPIELLAIFAAIVALATSAMAVMTWLVRTSTKAFVKQSSETIEYLQKGTMVKHEQIQSLEHKAQENTEKFHATIDKFENTIARIGDKLVPTVDKIDKNIVKQGKIIGKLAKA